MSIGLAHPRRVNLLQLLKVERAYLPFGPGDRLAFGRFLAILPDHVTVHIA